MMVDVLLVLLKKKTLMRANVYGGFGACCTAGSVIRVRNRNSLGKSGRHFEMWRLNSREAGPQML